MPNRTLVTVALVLWALVRSAAAQSPPNIVVIYADDLGYGDVGAYGAKSIPTPNVDRLARAGLRFTDAHSSAATCTPSRYALLDRRVRVSQARDRRAPRRRGAGDRAGPDHAGLDAAGRGLRDRRRGEVAPRPRAEGRTGLERRHHAGAARHRLRRGLHHGRHRRSGTDGLRREPSRRRPRPRPIRLP